MSLSPRWRVVIGCDDAGRSYKDRIKLDLEADPRVVGIVDVGAEEDETTPYSSIAILAAEKVAAGEVDRAILICGTGIGMAISANKVPGVRATTAHDTYSCERSVMSNDCQILTLGERVIGVEIARRLVHEWLGYVFDQASPSREKVVVIDEYERTHVRSIAPGQPKRKAP